MIHAAHPARTRDEYTALTGMRSTLLTLTLVVACYQHPSETACVPSCIAEDRTCPAGLECGDDLLCHATGEPNCTSCGVIGAACCDGATCTDGTQCLTGSNGLTKCAAFAGAFETAPPNTCSPAQLECAGNPLTGGCACPAGFSATSTNFDVGCPQGAPQLLIGPASFCEVSTLLPNSDWAGAFVLADLAECEPSGNSCLLTNTYTGSCSCPGSITPTVFRIFVPGLSGSDCEIGTGANSIGGLLELCLPDTPPITLAGVYELDPTKSSGDANGCDVFSSNLSGCACPTGAVAATLSTVRDDPVGSNTTYPTAQIVFCLIPP